MLEEDPQDGEIIARVAALDIGKAEVVCCVRVPHEDKPGRRCQEVTTHSTMTRSLLAMSDHLRCLGVTRVVMESTSDYWKPVFYLLEAQGFDQTGHHRVLRSKTPELVKQEIWSLLLTHYAIRHVMKDAADTVGTDPDNLSFIRSYRAIRRQVTNQAGFPPKRLTAALKETTDEIIERPNPPRQDRTYPRVVKRYRAHSHRIKRTTDHGQLHNGPPKIHIFKVPCLT